MKRISLVLMLAASLGAVQYACAQVGPCARSSTPQCLDSQTITTSGNAVTITGNGGLAAAFELIIAGSPSTVSIVTRGCGDSGTCTTLDTYTTVANSVRSPTVATPYAYYTVTASWTGGTSVSVKVNTRQTTAAVQGGGAVGLVAASTPAFSPTPGSYGSTQSVTPSCTNGTMTYNITGSAPVLTSTPISVATSETIKAACTGNGYNPAFASGAYTITYAPTDNFPGSSLSANWTVSTGAFAIASNLYTGNSAAAIAVAYWNAGTAPNDQFAQMTIGGTPATGGDVGVVVRWQSGSASGYALDVTSAGANLRAYTSGSSALLASATITVSPGDVFKLDVQGTTLNAYQNGVGITGLTGITDATYASGQGGIFAYDNQGNQKAGTWSAGTP